MAGRTAWTAGNSLGLSWVSLVGSGDLTSLAAGASVLSTNPVLNSSYLDQFMDVSVEITVTGTPSAGGYIGLWLAIKNEDGSTYGDGTFTAGTAKTTYIPAWAPAQIVPIANTSLTKMIAYFQGIILPPTDFALVIANGTSLAFSATAANNVCKGITYNINDNN